MAMISLKIFLPSSDLDTSPMASDDRITPARYSSPLADAVRRLQARLSYTLAGSAASSSPSGALIPRWASSDAAALHPNDSM